MSVLLLAGTAAMAQDPKGARPVRTPWPVDMPCAAPAYLRVSYASGGSFWESRSGATLALAEGGSGVRMKLPQAPDASFFQVKPGPTPGRADVSRVAWYLFCADSGDASIQWSCTATTCDTTATYPGARGTSERGRWNEATRKAVAALLPDSGQPKLSAAHADALSATARGMLRELDEAIDSGCPGQRCSNEVRSLRPVVKKLAASKRWKLAGAKRGRPENPAYQVKEGAIATFRIPGQRATVEVHCNIDKGTEAPQRVCGLVIAEGKKTRVRYGMNWENRGQNIATPGGFIYVSTDEVSVQSSALRTR